MTQQKAIYDVVIVGSGLGGLVAAIILAKEGRSVCVLEKNNQYGGNLQTFVREKTIFDTGIHYIGALGEGQNLNKYFRYLGIMDDLKLKRMDKDCYDIISFEDEGTEYPHAQGYENFIAQLLKHFPEEREALQAYCRKLEEVCNSFPLYNLNDGKGYGTELLTLGAKEYFDSITDNEKLKAVLVGSNFLYVGIPDKTPFYVHALSVNSYIQSAWRCIKGGSQITKLLVRELRKHGGHIFKHQEVTAFDAADKKVRSVRTGDGKTYRAGLFISNIEPKTTLKLVGEDNFRKSFYTRIQKLEPLPSSFSIYIVFKKNTVPYYNHNYYHFRDSTRVWTAHEYTEASWPEAYMASMNVSDDDQQYAESMTAITYMNFDELLRWEQTHNTIASAQDRGKEYERLKQEKMTVFLEEVERKFPHIKGNIKAVHASTPLSYRDYIGGDKGNLYGYVKDARNPLNTIISTKTKLDNLYLTGQSINMHGVLGVTISAVLTCSEILGKEYLLQKIHRELAGSENGKTL